MPANQTEARTYGGQNTVDPLHRVIVRRPDTTFDVDDPKKWNYVSKPDLADAQKEHDGLVATLREAGAEVIYHDDPIPGCADSIFVCDPAIMTDRGAILLQMGKELRRDESDALAACFEKNGIPVYYRMHGEATGEAGDMQWIDEKTLAVGHGFRTNAEGIRQMKEALEPLGVEVFVVELPYFTGPKACLHLRTYISMLDHDLAVVHPQLMAVPFWLMLQERGIQIVEVPDEEFDSMAPNVLALGPRKVLMLEGNPITKGRLEEAGCEVHTYRGNELSLKAEGGATCLTQPVLRLPQA